MREKKYKEKDQSEVKDEKKERKSKENKDVENERIVRKIINFSFYLNFCVLKKIIEKNIKNV